MPSTRECKICSGHYHRTRRHCPICGAQPLHGILLPNNGLMIDIHKTTYVNHLTSKPIARATSAFGS